MIINNAKIFCDNHKFSTGMIEIENGIIKKISKNLQVEEGADIFDAKGAYASPGLVDIHFHGCVGVDLCDALENGIEKMAEYEAACGITTICPATMTMSEPELHNIMKVIGSYQKNKGAHFAGVNMEGPFISKKNKGAQAEENIIPCDVELFHLLQEESGNRIRLVDIAPEETGALDFVTAIKNEAVISIAHTKADYETSMAAFSKGADHVTHLCNAMPPLHHRDPGVIGAARDAGAYVELICDGVHIHPSMVRAIFQMFDKGKICLISDSMRATGLEDGEYTLGGQMVHVHGALATLCDGTIAGSVTNLMKCMVNAVKNMGIRLEDAIVCASENPAKSIGIFDICGSLSPGKRADIVLLDAELNMVKVFIG